jgi:acetate---CoA ligase (ADP-forming)
MKQVAGGEEVLLGARRDQSFGPLVAFGAGGIWTEIMEDVALRVAPISPREARRQILETRMGAILSGARGRPPPTWRPCAGACRSCPTSWTASPGSRKLT